jgi:uncharacterized oxidoreductase
MNLQHQTVFITGGSSGIGLELAKQLIAKQNTVIICGRSAERLAEAKRIIPGVHTFPCDISIIDERTRLVEWMAVNFPSCNILINNAALAHKALFDSDEGMLEKADLEIHTNLIAPIALCKLFLPFLKSKRDSMIINITTGLVYAPRAVYPVYNATKAALHSFTQVIRHQLSHLPLRIVEVFMPVVDTPWHKEDVPKIAIAPDVAVKEMIAKIEKVKLEIRVGKVGLFYLVSRIAPGFAFKIINKV